MITPRSIAVDVRARTVTLEWDGTSRPQTLAHALLRGACPCAQCRRARLASGKEDAPLRDVPADVAIVDLQPMGYGVQIAFSDGHAQGIFPWTFLRALDAAEHATEQARATQKTTQEKRPA